MLVLMLVTLIGGGLAVKFRRYTNCWHCVEQYVNCHNKNECHLKKNNRYIKYCKRVYKDCLKFCKEMVERLRKNDFPSSIHQADRDGPDDL